MALAGSVVAAKKPATSNADNAIESFMLFSLYQRLQMISERPALRFSPLLSAMERLTTASPAGLIQIKGARSVRRTTSAIPAYVNLPRRPPARSCATPRKHRSRPPEQQDAFRCGHRPKQMPALDRPHVAVAERGVVHKGEVSAPKERRPRRTASRA